MNLKEIDAMYVQEMHSDTRNESDWKIEWGERGGAQPPAGAWLFFSLKLCPSILLGGAD